MSLHSTGKTKNPYKFQIQKETSKNAEAQNRKQENKLKQNKFIF